MALPNIEDEWDHEHVMSRLYELAAATFGTGQ